MTAVEEMRPDPANVVEAIARVMVELPGVGKDRKAAPEQGGYAYRGIEDITAAAQTLCGRYGLVFVPDVVNVEVEQATVGSKSSWTLTKMRVRYTALHGPSETSLRIGGKHGLLATALDNSDKGANKCMTQAYKQMLLQTFMVGDKNDDVDGSGVVREDTPRQLDPWEHFGWSSPASYEHGHERNTAAWAQLAPAQLGELRGWLTAEHGISRKWPLPADVAQAVLDRIRAMLEQDVEGKSRPLEPYEPPAVVAERPLGTGPEPTAPEAEDDAATANRAPSASALLRAGASEDDLDVALQAAQKLTAIDLTNHLRTRGMAINGNAAERQRRLASMLVMEEMARRKDADVVPISSSLADVMGVPADVADFDPES